MSYEYSSFLPRDEVQRIQIKEEIRDEVIIGLKWNPEKMCVYFLLGNMATISIPCSFFSRDKTRVPDFAKPKIENYGFDVSFGSYVFDPWDIILK